MKFKFSYLLVFCLIIFLYWAINNYIAVRIWQFVGKNLFLNKKIYMVAFWILAFTYIFSRFGDKYLPEFLNKSATLIGAYYMAVMVYLMFILFIVDIIRLFNNKLQFIPNIIAGTPKFELYTGFTVLLTAFLILLVGTINANTTQITNYNIQLSKKLSNNQSMKVVMVSDIHLGMLIDRNRLEKMVTEINELKPDLVLMPGDIIDDDIKYFERHKLWEPLSKIQSKYGVYASLGNHESFSGKIEEGVRLLEKSGMKVLQDESVLVNNSFYVLGRKDLSSERYQGNKRKSLEDILINLDTTKPMILLDHQPYKFEDVADKKIDLMLSGHTHRGQIFPGDLITGKIFELDWGYIKKGASHFIVSSGYGTWGPPIRNTGRAEIVQIQIFGDAPQQVEQIF